MSNTNIFPVKILQVTGRTVVTCNEVNERTMKELGLTEADLEEFVRTNVEILFPEGEETLLIIGQQVRNRLSGRADLVALDKKGNIVLIELKRDRDDIAQRKEPFEFQAIRYAANYALIKTQQDIVRQLFAPYIERHRDEPKFQQALSSGLTASELATRILAKFLQDNQAQGTLNRDQRILLIAASFDGQTLSACAWLAKNNIDVRCIIISPMQYDQQYFFKVEQIIPPPALEKYYVEIAEPTISSIATTSLTEMQPRQVLPRMNDLLNWGLVSVGDRLYIRYYDSDSAEIIDHAYVKYQEQKMKYNDWGQKLTGWSSINIYEWTVHEPTNKTLDTLRREKLEELSQDVSVA